MKTHITLLLITLLSKPLFGAEPLYDHIYWHKLLHFKNGESQIDDVGFFLSPEGRVSPKAELEATLEALKKGDYRDLNSTACRYPARTRWIKEQLPKQDIRECQHLPQTLQKFDFQSLYLVYASAYMNSPASMVGHTFLRFDRDEKNPLLSYALNYSAKIENNISMISYIYDGLFGGFEGRYSVAPYYEMVKIYSDMEHRDMWEYRLDFTPKEIERIVLHIFEIERFYSDYFFFNENCSYNLLWFIELGREELDLVDRFEYIVAPLDTIRELKEQNLIERSVFRASKIAKIKHLYRGIRNREIAKRFLEEPNIALIKNLPKEEQREILELYFLKDKERNRVDLLRYRSRLGIKKETTVPPTSNPLISNKSTRVSIGESNQEPEVGMRLAYHDIYDLDHDLDEGSYISFFDIEATAHRLNSLKLIEVNSLAKQDDLYKPYSWGVEFGLDRERDDRLQANLKLRGGESFEIFDTLVSLMPTLGLEYRDHLSPYIGYRISMLRSFDRVKVGIIKEQLYFEHRDDFSKTEAFLTYQFMEDMALNLSVVERREEKFGLARVFFYF